MKSEDEIMAGYLLKGGKMLSKTCASCGCPLFEYKGETFCAVCREGSPGTQAAEGGKEPAPGREVGKETGKESCWEDSSPEAPGRSRTGQALIASLDEALIALAGRAREEQDPERVLVLMNAIKRGIEARNLLR